MSGSPRIVPSLLSKLSRAIGPESAATELRWMRQTLANQPRGTPPSGSTLEEMVARRVQGEPLQYILGSQPFGSLSIAVRPPVLIPRPETEDWTIRLSETMSPTSDQPLNMLDLCTGTGCIPLLLCHLWPPGSVHATGIDISAAAVQLANENAHLCGITTSSNATATTTNGGHRAPHKLQNSLQTPSALATGSTNRATALAEMAAKPDSDDSPRTANGTNTSNTFTAVLADLMCRDFTKHARLLPPYDLITANPPYIPKAEYDGLSPSVRDYEDVRALLGDPAHAWAPPRGGTLALEVGDGQAAAVAAIVERKARVCGDVRFRMINVWTDPWGKERAVVARG
ncbi:S-adenosyl-L-methionine-dependent methyltransferase [Daedaleopsis nitida]|nr:S-adenosyl-L-methionine-dependent methyltransferase [Daedaleopsis nitida]